MKCAYCHKKIKTDDRAKIIREGKLVFCSSSCHDSYKDSHPSGKVVFNPESSVIEAKIDAPEFDGHEFKMRFHFWSGPRLYLDDNIQKPVRRSLFSYTRFYKIKDENGRDIDVTIKSKILDPTPVIKIEGRSYPITYDLRWYEFIWLGLPLLLFLLGGLLGIIIGAVTIFINSRYFQSRRRPLEKYSLTGLIMIVGFLGYYHAAGGVRYGLNRYFAYEFQKTKDRLHGEDPVVYYLTKHPWVVSNVINSKGKVMEKRVAEFKGDIKYFHKNGNFTQLHKDGSQLIGTWYYAPKGHNILLDAGKEVMVLHITRISDNDLNLLYRGITVEHHKKKEK